jgi:hypothetical protein
MLFVSTCPHLFRACFQVSLPPQINALQHHIVEHSNAHLLRLLEGSSLSENLATALRALDVGARPLFAVATEGVLSGTALLLASSLKRIHDAAMKPCPALADKRGAPWAAEVLARSITFADEVARLLLPELAALDPLLSVTFEDDFVLKVMLRAPSPLPPPAFVSLELFWVEVIATTEVFVPVAKRWVPVLRLSCTLPCPSL